MVRGGNIKKMIKMQKMWVEDENEIDSQKYCVALSHLQ